jgi:transcriptional regulator
MSLGKPKPHSAKEIRERREKVLILMAKGHNQSDIAKELHTTRNTIMRDIKEINEWTRKGLYDLAKQSLSTMLYSCIIGLNEIEKEAWKIYKNNDNDKVNALRLLVDICKSIVKIHHV